ncbi:hypothetical protein FB192DRAFT_1270438 [Mucor lusitanicus]|uniref:Uncharacterized protein n=1 Tax=Mucor circinelloides f. lusitanicus TaxID=29924 RepID=A0A8H4F5S0_MUCCL|nr:hypothetical protein FB192DRAFT_1270438 [Mucor lusitanicus]
MIEDVYSSTPAEWLQQMTRWQYFTPESLEEMTQEGLEEIFQQYAQTIEAFRPVKSAVSYHYDDDIFDDEDDGQGDDLWIAEDEQDLPLPPTILPSHLLEQQQSQLQEQEQESCQSKTNSVDSSTSTIFSQPNATLSNESINNEMPARAPSPLTEKPLPANPVVLAAAAAAAAVAVNDDTAKQARRKSGFGGNKNRLSWTSDTGITSSVVSQNLANEIMSLFDMDFAIDIKVDTAPKLPELPFKPRRRSQQRQSQDMLTSLIPAFEKIALENSIHATNAAAAAAAAANKAKPNLVIRSVPQRSSSLRHRQELQLDTKSPLSPPATPSDSPTTVEKSLSKKKSLLRLASLMTGKKTSSSHKDLPNSPEPSSSSSWSFVSDNGESKMANRPQKPLPEPPTSPHLAPANVSSGSSSTSRSKRSAKKKRKSIMEKTMSKRKSNNALQSVYDSPAVAADPSSTEKGLGRSKSAFIKIGNGLKSKKQLKQIRRTSSAKNFSETIPSQQQALPPSGDIGTHFHYHTSSEVNNMYTAGVSDETIVPINASQQSFVKRMASFNWRIKPKHKQQQQPVEV